MGATQQALLAYGAADIPFASDLIDWWDSATGVAVTGALVDTWTGRKNGVVLTGTTTTRPTLITAGGQNYLSFSDDYMDMPGTLTWDRRNSSLFVACTRPVGDTNNRSLWHMGIASTTDATYFNDQDLRLFNGSGVNSTGLNIANNITNVCRIANGATNVAMYINSKTTTVAANDAGNISDGYLGLWNTGVFPYVGDVLGVAAYSRTLNASEIQQVQDFFTAQYKSASRTYNKFLNYDGDSLTFGTLSTNPTYYSYPAQLAQSGTFQPIFTNVASGGARIILDQATMIARTNLQVNNFSNVGTRTSTLWIGTNDINAGATAAAINSAIDSYVSALRTNDASLFVVGCTIIARGGFGPAEEAVRTAVNLHITTGGVFDAVVDLAGNAAFQNPANATYYNADQIHLTDLGYGLVASLVKSSLVANSRI